MKTRIFDVKTRYASLLALMLGLMAAGPAMAACDVILSAILPSNQAVLKADCGPANMTEITWTRDLNAILPLVSLVLSNSTFPATLADINFTTLLTSGTHSYTASGFFGGTAGVPNSGTAVASGKAAVITLSQPILTVAVSPGGEVDGVPPGITDCRISGGTCVSSHDTGTSVVLTATADTGFTFASWGDDCRGITTNTCTLSMTTLRTATATFGTTPAPGQCGAANNVSSVNTPTALCTTGTPSSVGSAGYTWNWACAGPNNGSSASCSAPQIVAGVCGSASGSTALSAAPSGIAACGVGNVASTASATNFTWGCNGINGGNTSATACSAPVAPTNGACGTANGTTVATAPTSTAACSAGTSTTPTNPSNTFSWTCNGLAGGSSQACTADQSTPTPTAATAPTPTTTCAAPAGWTCRLNPVTLDPAPGGTPSGVPLGITVLRTYVFSAPANVVHAFAITFDAKVFTGSGARLQTNQYVDNANRRNMYISDAPGSTSPVDAGHYACLAVNNDENSVIYVNFTTPGYGTCFLEKNKQYWLNIKATDANTPVNYLLQPFQM